MDKRKNTLLLFLRGILMGAADVVPGVSGGTIAFISGIYEELVASIKECDLAALKLILKLKFKDFWTKINGKFLLPVILGIGMSIFTLASLMTGLLKNHPILVWSFFFGLIIASVVLVYKMMERPNLKSLMFVLFGFALALWITLVSPASTTDAWWFIIFSGALAICAMILPGISGSFMLLLIGKYSFILAAVSSLNIRILLLFAVGAIIGIIAFSHVLSWFLKHYKQFTMSVLVGFIIGSLNKVWPWKMTLTSYIDSHGIEKALTETNVLPNHYANLTGNDPNLIYAIFFCILGFSLIFIIEQLAKKI